MSAEQCRLCGADSLVVFHERSRVPVHQNLPLPTPEAARAVTRGDLRLACCTRCGFISNLAFSDELLRYSAGYENDQTCSPLFDRYIDGLAGEIVDKYGVRDREVVEVGCGRGTFLRRLCQRGGNRGVGFDPAHVGDEVVDDGRVRFVRAYYGPEQATVPADAVICRHVIEHVPAPMNLIAAVRGALSTRTHADLFFETPDVEWILDNVVLQDFFYEHCSYFSAETLAFCFSQSGFADVTVERVFGEQYLWLHAVYRGNTPTATIAPPAENRVLAAALRFEARETALRSAVNQRVQQLRSEGPLAVWGAGAKGVTFVNHFDADGERIDCVVDINPRKQGRFVPGTGHAIVAPDDLGRRGVRHIVVMNPNYAAEIRDFIDTNRLPITLHLETDS